MTPCPLSDEQLKTWADEHLDYEVGMLSFAALALYERREQERDEVSNVLLESFAVHTRCLRDFFFGERDRRHPRDAFARDFCQPGAWESARGPIPPALAELDARKRYGHEVVHLSYDRSTVPAGIKDWPVGKIMGELAALLNAFSVTALPSRLSSDLMELLAPTGVDPMTHVLPVSVATIAQMTGGWN